MEVPRIEIIQSYCRGFLTRRVYNKSSIFRRFDVINEFSTTEVSFVDSMRKLDVFFNEPLIERAKNPETTILPLLMIKSILPRIESVFLNGCLIANTFEDIRVRWKYDSCFGDALVKCIELMAPLAEYTLLFETQRRSLVSAFKVKGFKEFIKRQSIIKDLNGLSFNDLIIMPVQRLMRYPILLKELIKNTSSFHPEYQRLEEIQLKFEQLISNVNTQSKMHDCLLDVSSCICCSENLVQSWRYCLYYGWLLINSPTTLSFAFLFNDRICYIQNVCELSLTNNKTRYLQWEQYQQIRFLDVKRFGPSGEEPRTFEIHCGTTIDYLFFPDGEDFEEWVNVLNSTLSQFIQLTKRF
ncbi:Rho/RAC guanine nucleotide exchange factor, putative [Entamoeba dispar SAW760]|uniref:Rho/RAC guanine nucleotide exchange factor, putative n=1 Tax=Entamoeba dispar (strain ATCC PRA-260 / SAW760) TaxID=370354 RepID=B0E7W5_ENTDS|nr:Rho/RAC guanine nucleotide exchange factor, putative [Entamoeba dispar SAW760]EDR29355.1 Rho/RAC guanine nucleotide exchange factor, putative [Entamoeba dispar SAW760]|eukprot:EDR29355.1 Rho/RAC guanine nucleotide exchange factor, putative [Entamoeba dispar SAW760]